MGIHFPEAKADESYFQEWKKRFEDGWEWQKSGYACRRTLRKIGADVYPTDLDEFFQRED